MMPFGVLATSSSMLAAVAAASYSHYGSMPGMPAATVAMADSGALLTVNGKRAKLATGDSETTVADGAAECRPASAASRTSSASSGGRRTSSESHGRRTQPGQARAGETPQQQAQRERSNAARRAARASREAHLAGLRLLAAARWAVEPPQKLEGRIVSLEVGTYLPTGRFGALCFRGERQPYRVKIGIPAKATNNSMLLSPLQLDVRRKYGTRCEEKMRLEHEEARWRCPILFTYGSPGKRSQSGRGRDTFGASSLRLSPCLRLGVQPAVVQ
jgi:hypothetical protein